MMEPVADGFFEDMSVPPKKGRVRKVVYLYDRDDDDIEPTEVDGLREEIGSDAPIMTTFAYRRPYTKEEVSPKNPRIGMPGPIALFAFGFTVVLCNIPVAGLCANNAYTACMAIFVGGFVQFVAGYMELVNKNTVGCIICTGYGSYNFVLGVAALIPSTATSPATDGFMGAFFLTWMFFAFTVLLMCLHGPLFGTLLNTFIVINFFCSAVANFAHSDTLSRIIGYEGIFAGAMAVYYGMAQSVNAAYDRNIFPVLTHNNFRNIGW